MICMHPDIKLKVSCRAVQYVSVHGGKKNVIANSNTAVFLSLVSPHWNCRFNVWRNDSNAELLTIPVNLLAVTSGNLSVAFAFWSCIWVGDEPLKGVYKAMMFVDRAVGNGAAKIKSLSLYQLLERRCVYLPQTRAHTRRLLTKNTLQSLLALQVSIPYSPVIGCPLTYF